MPNLADGLLSLAGTFFSAGGTWIARRPHTLRDTLSRAVSSLEFATAALAGHTSISLRLIGAATPFKGRAPAGLGLVIGGVPHVIGATADVDAATNRITVTISPGLSSPKNPGDAVSVDPYAAFSLPGCLRQDPRVTAGGELFPGASYALLIPTSQAPSGFKPAVGDVLVAPDGSRGTVLGEPFVGDAGVWEVVVGERVGEPVSGKVGGSL